MIPGLGRSRGEGKGYPLKYSGLENSLDCIVHGVAKSWTQLRDFDFHLHLPLRCSQLTILLYFQVNNEGTQTCIYMYLLVQSLSCVLLFVTLWTAAHQAPLSMDSPGKNTRVGCHFLLQGIFLTHGSNLSLLNWQADTLHH